jgi:hypothetical protein
MAGGSNVEGKCFGESLQVTWAPPMTIETGWLTRFLSFAYTNSIQAQNPSARSVIFYLCREHLAIKAANKIHLFQCLGRSFSSFSF